MIRVLAPDDAAIMAAIHKQSFPSGWPEEDMRRHIEKDVCLGVGTPVEAFILLQVSADQADILTLATNLVHRRKGLARQILREAEKQIRDMNVKTLYLDVSEINDAAIALYKSVGFQAIGRRPAYYRTAKGRVAAITFSKTL